MIRMYSDREVKEVLDLLRKNKLEPMLVTTPVPFFDAGVRAGVPTDMGASTPGRTIPMPVELVGMCPCCIIPVAGDSMKNAGIQQGDLLKMQMGTPIYDGDTVVVSIDGECTVKAYYEDEDGEKWLVPRNEAYEPIHLTEEMNVRILGKVTEHIRSAPRTPHNEMRRCVNQVRSRTYVRPKPDPGRVRMAIGELGQVVKHGRQWYAVYCALVERGVVEEGAYSEFCQGIEELLPDHGHLPVSVELRRMSVQSFRKPIAQWERDDAPVSGQRFDDYLRIARLTLEKLR